MKRSLLLLVAMLSVVMLVVAACGDDDGGAEQPAATSTPAAGTTATAAEESGEGDPAAGQQIAQAQCFTCHSIDGSKLVGPTWQGLYGREVELEDGTTVTADDAYIRESILNPSAKIVKGYPNAMPPFQGLLTDQQITDIIAYIKTLE